jgi:hypothetical protein
MAPSSRSVVLNCMPSQHTEDDWTFGDALAAGFLKGDEEIPPEKDLREDWWEIKDQGNTGACVGYATACGVLQWHYVKTGRIAEGELPSARFIWMANKETDNITRLPTTFLENDGTQTKLALRVAQKYGCVLDEVLSMEGENVLSKMNRIRFYTKAAQLRIASYHNLGRNLGNWHRWLAFQGPILTRLSVDKTWMSPPEDGHLKEYEPELSGILGEPEPIPENPGDERPPPTGPGDGGLGGHAVCLVGYAEDYFIVRNSWGKKWGDGGFAYAHNEYASRAFTEAYGVIMPEDGDKEGYSASGGGGDAGPPSTGGGPP